MLRTGKAGSGKGLGAAGESVEAFYNQRRTSSRSCSRE